VYYGDAMHLASTVRVCGNHFTRDLAGRLRLSFEEAEQVKLEYGCCALSAGSLGNVLVELPTPEDRDFREEQWKVVSMVLEARAVELFRFVRAELARVGMDRALNGGAFLTGGAARLPDLCDVAARVLNCQTRFGLTVGILDWPREMDDPEWTTAAGLAMYSAKLKAKAQHQRETAGWLGKILK
jgi:cell division protein FtsA